MGRLFYGNATEPIVIPDQILAHAKVVIVTKLRRNESFTLSWSHVDDSPGARTTIWLQPAIPPQFVFDSANAETIHPATLRDFAEQASSPNGLVLDLARDLENDLRALPPVTTRRVARATA